MSDLLTLKIYHLEDSITNKQRFRQFKNFILGSDIYDRRAIFDECVEWLRLQTQIEREKNPTSADFSIVTEMFEWFVHTNLIYLNNDEDSVSQQQKSLYRWYELCEKYSHSKFIKRLISLYI